MVMPIRLAVVVPVYGNSPTLVTLYERIDQATKGLPCELTIQFVNDRSPDDSQDVLESLAARDPRVRVILLSRNHGSILATVAGISEVRDHDAVVLISADLQDPPESIPELLREYLKGKKVVLGVRRSRQDPPLSTILSNAFHWLIRRAALPGMPVGGFDFCLISRQVVDAVLQSAERRTSLVGLILWAGFERGEVLYDRASRPVGSSMWTLRKKLAYACDTFISFSSLPLRLFFYSGLAFSILALLISLAGLPDPDTSSSAAWLQPAVLAFTLTGLGVLGAYLWNLMENTRTRPIFLVDRRIGHNDGTPPSCPSPGVIPFYDQPSVSASIRASLGESCVRVLDSPRIILGPEVARFEKVFAAIMGTGPVAGVANGTDAITLSLWAGGLGHSELVAVPAISAPATAVAVLRAGCRPVFVDVSPDSLTLDPKALLQAVSLGIRAVVPVHLYGNPCAMDAIMEIAEANGLLVVEDCAQSAGSRHQGKPCGSFGQFAAFSFYPTKNLGAYGDGGAVATRDENAVRTIRRLGSYGLDEKGECVERGMNSRLDELQAALLLERLKVFDAHCEKRIEIASLYDKTLGALAPVPSTPGRVPHLYVVRHDSRDSLKEFLFARNVNTVVHYPLPLHLHRHLAGQGVVTPCPVAEAACPKLLSLPCHPGLTLNQANRIAEFCLEWAGSAK